MLQLGKRKPTPQILRAYYAAVLNERLKSVVADDAELGARARAV
jgi:hypothetical protein